MKTKTKPNLPMLRKYNNEKNLPRCYKKHWYLISGHSRIVSCKRVTSKYVKFFGNATEKVCLLLIFEVAFFISFCWVCATMKFLCFMLAGMLCMHYVLLWVSWTWNDTFFSYWFFFCFVFLFQFGILHLHLCSQVMCDCCHGYKV